MAPEKRDNILLVCGVISGIAGVFGILTYFGVKWENATKAAFPIILSALPSVWWLVVAVFAFTFSNGLSLHTMFSRQSRAKLLEQKALDLEGELKSERALAKARNDQVTKLTFNLNAWQNASHHFSIAGDISRVLAYVASMESIANLPGQEAFKIALEKPLSDVFPIGVDEIDTKMEKWRFQQDVERIKGRVSRSLNFPISITPVPNDMKKADVIALLAATKLQVDNYANSLFTA